MNYEFHPEAEAEVLEYAARYESDVPGLGVSCRTRSIRMYYREHGVPHFHAEHQGQQATFTFDGEVLAGSIRSRTAVRLIKDWALAH